ncbi:phosphate ABC transporter substrate-binding protein PstS [Laspinema olomoucense]|uniref:phosphate ABC transporter substrate-binding protein PstS n=1 Tax=Laspinema olomoucense TaxID=3231600 RepID=UPI0021BB73A3|nr:MULTISPECIES: phosphate ABC transporter substrate-binding protein PstS [unclassified Laspinema]MCT7972160.1 phosphate ABC transporter substrate-binding protein PstS [Laspinema sp. D3d]MCT7993127.1 phosphate ABC transporter substrate-binding protein PstS [Laspinema sp. D3c]
MRLPNPIKPAQMAFSLSVIALTLGIGACQGPTATTTAPEGNAASPEGSTPAPEGNNAAPAGTGKLALTQPVNLTGAGATFPAPIYQRWFQEFNQANSQVRTNYQSVGSGAGVQQFSSGTVDFGASDVAMKDEEIQAMNREVLMLPMTAGGIVLAYNLPGVETGLKLPREVYVDILLGEITQWNDPRIAEANPGVNLPDQAIAVVYRSDGSGTTGVFTQHLSAISEKWKERVGEGKTVEWPTGIGGKGNEGVTASIQQTVGAIGYVEYGYAKNNNITMAALENKSGNFIAPSSEAASKTLAAVELPDNLRAFISDPEGPDSYPIVSYTWLLAYKEYSDPQKAQALEAVIEYGLNEGQQLAPELGYIPLPANVRQKVAQKADVISAEYDIEVSE